MILLLITVLELTSSEVMSVVEASGATFRDSRVGRRSIYFSRVENRLVALLGLLHLAFSLCRLVAFATHRYRRVLNASFDELESKRRIGRVGVTSNGSNGGTTGSAAPQLVGWAGAAVQPRQRRGWGHGCPCARRRARWAPS